MIALDTDILARAIAAKMDADAATKAQRGRAQILLPSGKQFFVPITVIEELEWLLRGAHGMPPDGIAALFEDMLAVENLTIDRAAAVGQAITWYRQGLDFPTPCIWPNPVCAPASRLSMQSSQRLPAVSAWNRR